MNHASNCLVYARPDIPSCTKPLPTYVRKREGIMTNKILIIVTNVGEYEKVGYRTGLWLGELTHFWDVAERAGFPMEIASPLGGYVPIDPESLAHDVLKQGDTEERYKDRSFM